MIFRSASLVFGTTPARLLAALVAVFVVLASWYSFTNPILEAPDEHWHYQVVREIAVNHGLPVVQADAHQPFAHEGLQPPLYYLVGAALIAWMPPAELDRLPAPNPFARIGEPAAGTNDNRNAFVHTADAEFPFRGAALAIHLLRLYSVLLGAGTVIFTYLLARELLGDVTVEASRRLAPTTPFPAHREAMALLAAAFVALLPQFLFISGAISNDNLAVFFSAAALWLVARLLRTGLSLRSGLVLGLLVGGALLSKLSTIALMGLVVLAMAYLALRTREWRAAIQFGIVVVVATVVVAGWWYLRNLQLYGELYPFTPIAALVGSRPTAPGLWQWLVSESEGLRLSTWGVFGWFNILAAPWFYRFFDALALLGAAGLVYAVVRRRLFSFGLALLPIWIVVCAVALWRYSSLIVSTQGRLLFPALPAWAVLWTFGLAALVPARLQRRTAGALAAALFVVAALTPWSFIAPAYAPTILAANQLASNAAPLDWRFGSGDVWAGVALDRATVRPGETLKLTLYQRVGAHAEPGRAVFIHLLNSADVIVAQRDSLINSGTRPLSSGELLASTYQLTIPPTAPLAGTDALRVLGGIYNPATGERYAVSSAAGESAARQVLLTRVGVQPAPAGAWHFDFSRQASLVGVDYAAESVRAGDALALTLHWGDISTNSGYHVFIHALGDNDRIWASADMPLDAARPTAVQIRFDPDTPAGVYPLELGVYLAPDGDRLAVFDSLGQDVGDRIFLGPIRVTR